MFLGPGKGPDMGLKKYVDERTTAEILGIGVQTLRNDRCLGRGLPYVKLKRSVRYDLDDVYTFMESHKIQPTA